MDIQIKNILYPTDFSDNAKHALPYALSLAKKTGATLHIMHSIEEPYDFAPMVEDIKKDVTRKVKKLYEDMIEDINKKKEYAEDGIKIRTHIFNGRTVYSLLSATRDYEIDLVVMGTQGRSALEQLFFGSTTSEVVQQSTVPVLAIPMEADSPDFKHLLFTSDYGPTDLPALEFTMYFAGLYNSSVKLIHVAKASDEKAELLFRGFKDMVHEHIKYKKLTFELLYSDDLLKAVTEQVNKHKINGIFMVRYHHLFSIIGKKHSKEMSQSSKVPVLVYPGKKESSGSNVVI